MALGLLIFLRKGFQIFHRLRLENFGKKLDVLLCVFVARLSSSLLRMLIVN